jgi:hypothetical protein
MPVRDGDVDARVLREALDGGETAVAGAVALLWRFAHRKTPYWTYAP